MRLAFTPGHPIVVMAKMTGITGIRSVKMPLDTGATTSMVRKDHLQRIGVNVDPKRTLLITSASDVQPMPLATVPSIQIGKHRRSGFDVLVHDLPSVAQVDGLLGMDFLAGLHLWIRMKHGILTLEEDSDSL